MLPLLSPLISQLADATHLSHREHRYGKVLMPLRVIYSSSPLLLTIGLLIEWIREHAVRLEPELRALVTIRCFISSPLRLLFRFGSCPGDQKRHWCATFCGTSMRGGPARCSRHANAPRSRGSMTFWNAREIAETTLVAAREVFSDRELVDLTWLQASEAYFNLQAHPLGVPSDELALRTSNYH
jgi:hypothetical protein